MLVVWWPQCQWSNPKGYGLTRSIPNHNGAQISAIKFPIPVKHLRFHWQKYVKCCKNKEIPINANWEFEQHISPIFESCIAILEIDLYQLNCFVKLKLRNTVTSSLEHFIFSKHLRRVDSGWLRMLFNHVGKSRKKPMRTCNTFVTKS